MALLANLPSGIASQGTFKYYHMMHHGSQGSDIDLDIPTHTEAMLFKSKLGKLIWTFLMPVFYSFRPMILKPAPL